MKKLICVSSTVLKTRFSYLGNVQIHLISVKIRIVWSARTFVESEQALHIANFYVYFIFFYCLHRTCGVHYIAIESTILDSLLNCQSDGIEIITGSYFGPRF